LPNSNFYIHYQTIAKKYQHTKASIPAPQAIINAAELIKFQSKYRCYYYPRLAVTLLYQCRQPQHCLTHSHIPPVICPKPNINPTPLPFPQTAQHRHHHPVSPRQAKQKITRCYKNHPKFPRLTSHNPSYSCRSLPHPCIKRPFFVCPLPQSASNASPAFMIDH
jgi:hypothetical protein